jgi:hypothetical protein
MWSPVFLQCSHTCLYLHLSYWQPLLELKLRQISVAEEEDEDEAGAEEECERGAEGLLARLRLRARWRRGGERSRREWEAESEGREAGEAALLPPFSVTMARRRLLSSWARLLPVRAHRSRCVSA